MLEGKDGNLAKEKKNPEILAHADIPFVKQPLEGLKLSKCLWIKGFHELSSKCFTELRNQVVQKSKEIYHCRISKGYLEPSVSIVTCSVI